MQVFNNKDYIPQRVGLQLNPPTIVIEYLIPSQQKLFRHKIKLIRLSSKSNTQDFVKYIKNRHHAYVSNSKLLDDQLETLIQRLKEKLAEQSQQKTQLKEQNQNQTSSKQPSYRSNESQNSKVQNINPFEKIENTQKNNQIKELVKDPIKVHVFEEIEINSDDDEKNNNQDNESEQYEEDFESQIDSDLDQKNLNKLTVEEVQKYKEKMEVQYKKNSLKPGDPGFVYDKQVEFKPKKNSDWDDD